MTRESPFCKRDEIADSPTHLSRAFLARCRYIFSGKNDEPTPDFRHRISLVTSAATRNPVSRPWIMADLPAFRRAGRRRKSADEVPSPGPRSQCRGRCATASLPSAGRVARYHAPARSLLVPQASARRRLARRRRLALDHGQPWETSSSRESLIQTHRILSRVAFERKVSCVSRKLTDEQANVLKQGYPVRVFVPELGGDVVVVLAAQRESTGSVLQETLDEIREQAALSEPGRRAAASWMKENPY